LESVESELRKGGNNKELRDKCYDRLLELRRRMDRYVEFWLRFEEKINDMQEKYDFLLPDEMPDSFLQAFGTTLPDAELKEMKSELEEMKVDLDKRGVKPLLLQEDNEAYIRSFRRGLGFLELAMMDEAIQEFKEVVHQEPELLLAHLCLGVAYGERGMADEAMRELRLVQALTEEPQMRAIVHNALGNVYADKEEYELAKKEFNKVLELDPDFAIARFNMGAVCYNLRLYEESVIAFEASKDEFPKDWEIYFYLGKGYRKLDNDEEALVNFLKASYLAPQEPYVAFELGLLYDNLGETRRALESYYRARKLYQEQDAQELH
ncbi:MAG: tetratricopeptide repeat protein, partial [Firmicutes bacterium]|nr:tetratricopeptide repeat protein [Bacillota bacterium]